MIPSQINLAVLPKARALYDNVSDSQQELNFKIGDILHVVERDVAGYSGWWLCHSGQKLGIAPGNRLRLITPGDIKSSPAKGELLDESFITDERISTYDVPVRLTAGLPDVDPWKIRQDGTSTPHTTNFHHDKPIGSGFHSPNRVSVLSMMSTGSSGMSESTRSSVDATYDVLPNRQMTTIFDQLSCPQSTNSKSLRGKSVEDQRDSYLEDYSVPRRGSDVSTGVTSDLYDSPRSYQKPVDQDPEHGLYDVPQFITLEKVRAALLRPFGDQNIVSNPRNATEESINRELTQDQNYHASSDNKHLVTSDNNLKKSLNNSMSESLHPVLKWQSDIQKHNSKLRNFILDCEDGWSDEAQRSYIHSHIKLCCLSLKTAVKELIDFCCNFNVTSLITDDLCHLAAGDAKHVQRKKSFDQEKLKIRVEMLKAALRQFEDHSNEMVSSSPSRVSCQSKLNSGGQGKSQINQQKELLGVANVLPQITDLLVIDLFAHCGASVPKDKKLDSTKASDEGSTYDPLPSLQINNSSVNSTRLSTSDQNTIRNRPLPPTPPLVQGDKNHHYLTFLTTTSTLPPQNKSVTSNIHHGHERISTPISPMCSVQKMSCPSFYGNDANTSSTLPVRKINSQSKMRPFYQHDFLPTDKSDMSKMETSEATQCPLQKPHLPSHLYDAVDNHRSFLGSTKTSDYKPRLSNQVQFLQKEQQQLNPLLGGSESDALLVDFYASQIDVHMELVKKATNDFKKIMTIMESTDEGRSNCLPHTPPRPIPSKINNVRHQSPPNMQSASQSSLLNQTSPTPKEFVLRSKFVILAAHKLVYVADAIARNLAEPSRYADVAEAANSLCDILKVAVNATKEAALDHDNFSKREQMNSSIAGVEVRSGELCRVISTHKRPQL